jgi:hypothetical protein
VEAFDDEAEQNGNGDLLLTDNPRF